MRNVLAYSNDSIKDYITSTYNNVFLNPPYAYNTIDSMDWIASSYQIDYAVNKAKLCRTYPVRLLSSRRAV